jgi:hypothetical protein
MHYPKRRGRLERVGDVGAVIMLGMLFGLIVLIFGLVRYFDPEARRAPSQESR